MSYQSVDVYVEDTTANKNPVEGVLVRVFDSTNTVFYSEATTDSEGRAGFTLWTNTYNLRFYKFGVQVKQPQVIVVEEPSGPVLINAFTASATIFEHPIANDPRLCRASGYFRDITGQAQPGLDIHIIGSFSPILLEGAGVLSERRAIRTDREGFACVDLIRGAKYIATVQGFEDTQRSLEVPDLPSVNLPDLLFPIVEKVSFDQDGPYSLTVGQVLELTPTVTASNGVPLSGPAYADVIWSSSDTSVLDVGLTSTTLQLTAKKAGTAELRAERRNTSIIHIPLVPILGLPQSVTVT